MILYHGTQNDFKEFQHDFIGQHATGEGFGFYFTDSESLAKSYANNDGWLIVADITINDSMSLEHKTITYKQFKQFLKLLDPTGDNYLSNWGDVSYSGYNAILNYATNEVYKYCENDVDLICEVINGGGHSMRTIYTLVKKLFGYDHIKINNWGDLNCTVFVILQPEQIKITSKERIK